MAQHEGTAPPPPARTLAAPFAGTGPAGRAVASSVARSAALIAGRRLHQPRRWRGTRLCFADGTGGRVYRETVVAPAAPAGPAVLVVVFRLRGVRGPAHTAFRWESELNTPMFAGFPGFVSKLWLAHDEQGRYRGVYEWDGPDAAQAYVLALGRVLSLVCDPATVRAVVLPGLRRDAVLADPAAAAGRGVPDWGLLTGVRPGRG